jgi:hypothetical protein
MEARVNYPSVCSQPLRGYYFIDPIERNFNGQAVEDDLSS